MRPSLPSRPARALLGFFALLLSLPFPASTEPLVLEVGLRKVTASGPTAVPLDHELRTGDAIRIMVRTSQPGYLYLFYRSGKEPSVRLWPQGAGAHRIEAREEITVPSDGNLRVTEGSRDETIQLLFARAPLKDPLAALKPNPRKIRQIRLRAIVVDRTDGAETPPSSFSADLDDQGVAVLEIPLRHR